MFDAIVVGARCAGSATARLLAQHGHRVLLVDRATFPSDTVSTHAIDPVGMQVLANWGLVDKVFATNAPAITKFVLNVAGGEFPNETDAGSAVAAPRRTVLDKLLVDEAAAAGAVVREGATVKEVRKEGERVVGIRAVGADGSVFEEDAPIVIGADGVHSFVARQVGAEQYDMRTSQGTGYYAYYAGTPFTDLELGFAPNRFAGIFPTNDGEACVFAGRTLDEFGDMRNDPDAAIIETLADVNPRIAEGTRQGKRNSRFFKYDAQPGFFRSAHGPGWALVGDAGLHIDPVTGRGIGHAFRDAELLSRAVHAGLTESRPMNEALDNYQQTRDRMSKRMFDITQTIAELQWTDNELLELFLGLIMETGTLTEEVATWSGDVGQVPSPTAAG